MARSRQGQRLLSIGRQSAGFHQSVPRAPSTEIFPQAGAGESARNERSGTASRAAIYARVSTSDQSTDLQLEALRAYAAARGWAVTEFTDHGVSGAKEKWPALDALVAAARARKVDVVVAVRLDRLARSVHHLVTLARELEALGVGLVITEQTWTRRLLEPHESSRRTLRIPAVSTASAAVAGA